MTTTTEMKIDATTGNLVLGTKDLVALLIGIELVVTSKSPEVTVSTSYLNDLSMQLMSAWTNGKTIQTRESE
jgi:NADH:ubiquinone oxidoreductase subunit K